MGGGGGRIAKHMGETPENVSKFSFLKSLQMHEILKIDHVYGKLIHSYNYSAGHPPRPFSSYHTALVLLIHVTAYGVSNMDTVKSHFKAMGLYNFRRGFGWAYKRGGSLYPVGLISGIKKSFRTRR